MSIAIFDQNSIVDNLEFLVQDIDGSAQCEQIFIVIDRNLWWRLYWNCTDQRWEVCRHDAHGWETVQNFSTLKLRPLIKKYKTELVKSRGYEHKTPHKSFIYKPSAYR
jgi:hypothetical protein